jgi:hypothetical protein
LRGSEIPLAFERHDGADHEHDHDDDRRDR